MRDSFLNSLAPPGLLREEEEWPTPELEGVTSEAKPGEAKPAPTVRLSVKTENTMRLLHALGYLYGCHGQTKRALVLQLIAARLAPNDAGILRSLAYTFLMDGAPDRALAVIERLRSMEDGDHPALDLLKSRALWESGDQVEARHVFREFVERRRQD